MRYFRERSLPIPTFYVMGEEDHMLLAPVREQVAAMPAPRWRWSSSAAMSAMWSCLGSSTAVPWRFSNPWPVAVNNLSSQSRLKQCRGYIPVSAYPVLRCHWNSALARWGWARIPEFPITASSIWLLRPRSKEKAGYLPCRRSAAGYWTPILVFKFELEDALTEQGGHQYVYPSGARDMARPPTACWPLSRSVVTSATWAAGSLQPPITGVYIQLGLYLRFSDPISTLWPCRQQEDR